MLINLNQFSHQDYYRNVQTNNYKWIMVLITTGETSWIKVPYQQCALELCPCCIINHCWLQMQGKWIPFHVVTHWGRVTHICVREFTIIGSDNGLSSSRRQTIIWTNAGMLWIRPLGTDFNEILIKIHIFSFNKMYLKYRPRNVGHFAWASMCWM